MFKKKFLLLVTIFLFLLIGLKERVMAKTSCHLLPGNTTCDGGDIPDLIAFGSVLLNGTNVLEKTDISGSLVAEKSHFNYLTVKGQASLHHCQISNTSHIFGALNADKTQFEKTLYLYGDKISLNDVTAKEIVFGEVQPSTTQSLYLNNNTHILGNVLFKKAAGKIYLSPGASVSGQVIGGQIIHE